MSVMTFAPGSAPTKVPLGPSEYATYVLTVANLSNAYLGKDYGLTANARSISIVMAGVLIVVSTLARAIKHHGISIAAGQNQAAAASVTVARELTAASVAVTPPIVAAPVVEVVPVVESGGV